MRNICIKKYVGYIYVALLFFALPIQADDYKHSVQGSVVDNYCCPVKINRKLCISLSIGIAAVLLIQGLGFQFQTVSIIKCAYIDMESPIITR